MGIRLSTVWHGSVADESVDMLGAVVAFEVEMIEHSCVLRTSSQTGPPSPPVSETTG